MRVESEMSGPEAVSAPEEMVEVGTAVATVLEQLNEMISIQQKTTLDLVMTTVQAINALTPPRPQDGAPESAPQAPDALPPASPGASAASARPEAGKPISLPEAREQALAEVYQTAAHALGIAFYNAAAEQQQLSMASQSILMQSANILLSLASSEAAKRNG